MQIRNPKFIRSAVDPSQYPPPDRPELALVGRSNVGKSSLLNRLAGRKGLAKVGGQPGKTQLINFFDIDGVFYLVDLPGYGFAKVSKEKREEWGRVIETYLNERKNLNGIILLVDSRHEPTGDDRIMMDWLNASGKTVIIAATKSDKLKRSEYKRQISLIAKTLGVSEDRCTLCSSDSGDGFPELRARIDQVIQN